jgi:two-component system phosphate regulon response regulator PhoB
MDDGVGGALCAAVDVEVRSRSTVRNIVFRFADAAAFAYALRDGDQELPLPPGESVADGQWVLAVFEIGTGRATAAAARGLNGGPGAGHVLAFEWRDWERLVEFAEAGGEARVIPAETPTQPSLPDPPTLPRDSPGAPGFHPPRKSDPLVRAPNARVLLVDDDEDIREVVGAMLDAVGLTVEASTSGEEALERMRAASFDLLVLDWNLPGMTGIELCRLIRRDPLVSTLPVLFLTAHASSRDVVDAFASGADDYVVKPFRAPELGARIFGLLRRARMGPSAF